MKLVQIVLILALLNVGCRDIQESSILKSVDTISLEFTVYSKNKISEVIPLKLMRDTLNDTIYYSYFDERMSPENRELDVRKFILDDGIMKLVDDELELIDTFKVKINNSNYQILKYETVNPIFDSEGADIFCREYGWIGDASYAWKARSVLTKWDGKAIDNKFINTILDDELGILIDSRNIGEN
ncbi:hypothetical protein [Catalinimonas niigatensis]|uniref:hypothetical protein n=1 Tax=Catalinimonas niigatensis TaxID=1397264 RepID=UPI00266650A7|nr:hypothetical protein [Catalinimonas niigatensis]WPP51719.1 hypothetical protein PZB72_04865 [Catalinimonas niigatensis]